MLSQVLSENPRLGWALNPPTTATIGDLEGIRLTETFQVSESEVQSFNRFADAVQEVITAAARASAVFGQLMLGAGQPAQGQEPRKFDPVGFG